MPAGQLHIGLMTLNHISEREREKGGQEWKARESKRHLFTVRKKEREKHKEKEREKHKEKEREKHKEIEKEAPFHTEKEREREKETPFHSEKERERET